MHEPRTRRAFLAETGRLGFVAASLGSLTALRPGSVRATQERERIEVLLGEIVHERRGLAAYALKITPDGWSESSVLETGFPFTHLGLHWRGDPLSRLEVRSSTEGEPWSPWRRTTVESPPAANPRGAWFAALVSADRHRLLQYRFPANEAVPEQLTITYLNSLDGPRRSLGPAPQLPPVTKGSDFRTQLIAREEWGADESIRFTPTGEEAWVRAYVAPRMVVVHHTATRNLSEDPAADVRAIYAFHTITQGFGDLGYHALIDQEGRIYEGRYGRDRDPYGLLERDVLSYGVVGGHTLGFNFGSTSVALLGNFQEAAPTEAAWAALEELLVFQHRRYQIDPRLSIDFALTTELWRDGLPTLSGHRDCTPTECPGDFLYQHLPALRERVEERITGGRPTPRAIVQAPRERNRWPGPASYEWQGTPPYDCVLEGFWRHPGQDPVNYRTGYDARAMPELVVTRQTSATFRLQEPGQYTLHLRPAGQAFADRVTVMVERQLVRDNADSEGVHRTEGWSRSRSVPEFNGADYEFANVGSGAEFTWELPIPETGPYRVQACWASGPDRSRTAPYTIMRDGEELETVTIDQSRAGGVWVTLASFAFVHGQTCAVTLIAGEGTADQVVIADAVRLVAEFR